MLPRAGHLRTNEGCWNPKIIDPLKNTTTCWNSSCLSRGVIWTAEDNGFSPPHPPGLKPSQRSSALSHGSRDRPRGHTMSPQQVRSPRNQKTQLAPSLLELSRSSAPAATFCFHFTFEKKKLQGHFLKLGNGTQTHAKFSPSLYISSS